MVVDILLKCNFRQKTGKSHETQESRSMFQEVFFTMIIYVLYMCVCVCVSSYMIVMKEG